MAKKKLSRVVRKFAKDEKKFLTQMKGGKRNLDRPDFIWHALLGSFATMGNSKGFSRLVKDQKNYNRISFSTLKKLKTRRARKKRIQEVCKGAGIRWPDRKAAWIIDCFEMIQQLGGLKRTKDKLLSAQGRDDKMRFLRQFPGIGPKYSRDIMMDVYDKDFRNSIALDTRVKSISKELGLSFSTYEAEEDFFLDVAREAGINGWELDRLLYWFRDDIRELL